jgi:hypothetical protein
MSWRDILGVSDQTADTHNSQNSQKDANSVNCADIADSAYEISDSETTAVLMQALREICQGIAITPVEVKAALSPEDIAAWRRGEITVDGLAAYARLLVRQRDIREGRRPSNYSERAICQHCGPIWFWRSGTFPGCPWCWNRHKGKPIPRPGPVQCADCVHFERIGHPALGHCSRGQPEAPAGLWATDPRHCVQFLPLPATSFDSS